ncbi:uncharacterized protein EDB93DRAFT_1249563 [Suillus bovinus]|uniref:uncharacterized protein n=1 Tax=Suillus bovinus TaxID=48563 RepID=UPI001B8806A2|nr:uncharacterized protein EDB93DRAFT_1249563 [Suillus bovinus]KAG2151071.1 hypothetical protein EDB93DRAFT_1249563 [Suillus bovinus]
MKHESRKFIDLIQNVSSKWANWDPPKPINVGDYGKIINETGEFDWEGNIYTSGILDIDMTDQALVPVETEGDDKFIVKSWGVTTKEATPAGTATTDAENVALRIEFQFEGRKRAAALVMYKPKYISLPNNDRLIDLLKNRPDVLKGKYIVTEVMRCDAYMMYMSTNKAESFSVTLNTTGPSASAFTWCAETTYGLYREGSNPTTNYMPLYRLKKPRSKFWWLVGQRGDEIIDDSIPKWEDVDPPWDPLDDEGEEDPIYDAEMHGDFGVFNDGYPDNNDDEW